MSFYVCEVEGERSTRCARLRAYIDDHLSGSCLSRGAVRLRFGGLFVYVSITFGSAPMSSSASAGGVTAGGFGMSNVARRASERSSKIWTVENVFVEIQYLHEGWRHGVCLLVLTPAGDGGWSGGWARAARRWRLGMDRVRYHW